MPSPVQLSKADARRMLVRHHFTPRATVFEAFQHLRSIQFDPIAPVGCNHDLVLQSRVPGYRIGDWEKVAYEDRKIYDGWDKQASLVPFEGWQTRRIFHTRHNERFNKILAEHAPAVQQILEDLRTRGPLLPAECTVKERREEWKGHWHGPNLAKQVLRSLWHTGQVMTAGRRRGHHLYDLTERVVPAEFYGQPEPPSEEKLKQLFLDRHHAIGFLRPTASYEVWSYFYAPERAGVLKELLGEGQIVPVEIEGVKAHATPDFLSLLDQPSLEPQVRFVAPLDQLMWDRKLVQHVFGFDYIWEIYVPEPKRKWGYYVLPVLYGDELVARVEFFSRAGVLEMKRWIPEPADPDPKFLPALEKVLREFMAYASASKTQVDRSVDRTVQDLAKSVNRRS